MFYVLSDMRQSNCGNLWLAPGSHRQPRSALAALQRAGEQPPGAVELRLAPGAAVIWRTAVWHCVGPQLSPRTRTIIHIGYHHRWLRPTDYVAQVCRPCVSEQALYLSVATSVALCGSLCRTKAC